jgi:hypothetical protein
MPESMHFPTDADQLGYGRGVARLCTVPTFQGQPPADLRAELVKRLLVQDFKQEVRAFRLAVPR